MLGFFKLSAEKINRGPEDIDLSRVQTDQALSSLEWKIWILGTGCSQLP